MPISTGVKALSAIAAVSVLYLALHRGNSASAATNPSDPQSSTVNDAPVPNATYGTRQPRKCPLIFARPTNAQAGVLLQCTMEYEMRDDIQLMQNVSVTVGAAHKYDVRIDSFANDQDISQPMYAIHGTALGVGCTGLNACYSNPWVNASGYCYALRGKAGYRCNFSGIPDRSQYKNGVAPPQNF